MTNILLVFLNDLSRIQEFNEIIDKFAEKDYKIYLLDNIKDDEYFSIDSLPELIELNKEQHGDINKVVVLSNARDLIFSWYRCYNSLVDDFIYFVDEDEKNYFDIDDKHFEFYYNLYEFNNIEKEKIKGKLYLSKFDTILLPIFYDLRYFDNFINYGYKEKVVKVKLNKRYKYNGYEYTFDLEPKSRTQSITMGKINKRIVFMKGQSQYDALRIGTDYRVSFFRKLGFEVDILDLLTDDENTITNKVIKTKTDFVYSSNCIGIDIRVSDGRNLYNALNIPFYGRLGDHPVNQLERILDSNKLVQFSCIDEENITYFKKYFPNKEIRLDQNLGAISKNYKDKRFKDRKIDILFAGSIINPLEIKKTWNKLDNKSRLIVSEITENALKNNTLIDIDGEITKLFNREMIINKNIKYRAYIHSCIEKYIRFYKRYELVKKLGESGLKIVCIGNVEEYKKLNKSGKLILKEKISYQELLDIFNDSKMLINMTGHLYNGVTERILSAMKNGAAVVTESDRFTEKNFINEENIILYNLPTFNKTIKSINYYLENIDALEKLAIEGQILARNKYDSRKSMLNIYRTMRELEFETIQE